MPGRFTLMFFLVCGFALPAAPPLVRGRVVANPQVPGAAVPVNLRLLLKANGQWLAHARADSTGHFLLDWPKTKDSVIDFFCSAPGLDTLYLQPVNRNIADTGELHFLFPCQPDSTASGDIVCPKCRKEDQVYPMVYGDPIVITRHFDTTGKVSYERTPKKQVQTDSIVRAARFYCRRDRITF